MAKKQLLKKDRNSSTIMNDEASRASFQEFFPIVDIENGCFVDNSGKYFPIVRIGTKNLDLMSYDDKEVLAYQLEEVFSSFKTRKYQFLIIPIPYDISDWNTNITNSIQQILKDRQKTDDDIINAKSNWERQVATKNRQLLDARLELLRQEKDWVTEKVKSGRLTTKKCYLSLDFKDSYDVKTAVRKADEIITRFSEKGVDAYLASEKELRLILNILCNPLQTSANDIPATRMPPVYKKRSSI
jgi:hypothetical protein